MSTTQIGIGEPCACGQYGLHVCHLLPKPSERIAEIRAEIVERELDQLVASTGIDADLSHFRAEALESPRTGVAAIMAYLDEQKNPKV